MSVGYEYNKKWIKEYNKSDKFKAYMKSRYLASRKNWLYERLGEMFDVVEQKAILQEFCERICKAETSAECKQIMKEAYDVIK